MIVILRTPFRPSSHVHRKHTLIHAEFPIEQTLRSEDAETQRLLMQEPWSPERRPEESLFVADYDGLRLLGVSEGALDTDLRRRVGGTANRHEEWLIDEASRDSFPASDPASSTQPGSIVNERYADAARERETVCGNSPA